MADRETALVAAQRVTPAVTEGTCRTCGRDLVKVAGERVYHPAAVLPPGSLTENPCAALLPIAGAAPGVLSFDVPEDQFEPCLAQGNMRA